MGGSPYNPAGGGERERGVIEGEPPEECPEAPYSGHNWEPVTLWVEDRGSDVTEAYERCAHCAWYRVKKNPVVYVES